MPTNFFINTYSDYGEQSLIEDLIVESIAQYGVDMFYLPRTLVTTNPIYREQEIAQFNTFYEIEMYVKNLDKFGGDGKLLSRFGLEIRDEIVFTCAQRRFKEEVSLNNNQIRPNEGDLIWLPLNNKVFQIKFVDHEAIFYQLGALQVYDLTCELFEYSNEEFNTGIPQIDQKYVKYSTDMQAYQLTDTDGDILTDTYGNELIQAEYNIDRIDPNAQNQEFQTEGDAIIDFTEIDPFSEGRL